MRTPAAARRAVSRNTVSPRQRGAGRDVLKPLVHSLTRRLVSWTHKSSPDGEKSGTKTRSRRGWGEAPCLLSNVLISSPFAERGGGGGSRPLLDVRHSSVENSSATGRKNLAENLSRKHDQGGGAEDQHHAVPPAWSSAAAERPKTTLTSRMNTPPRNRLDGRTVAPAILFPEDAGDCGTSMDVGGPPSPIPTVLRTDLA